jgi:hypothetical protein
VSADVYAVFGAGGHGREIMPLARQQLVSSNSAAGELMFVTDDSAVGQINGHRVITYDQFLALPAGRRLMTVAV